MADAVVVLEATFTTLLVLNLLLMTLNTYFLSRKPVLHHLREIYFINSASFKRAWYLVIAAMTLFIVAQAMQGYASVRDTMTDARVVIFEVAFAALVLGAFLELLLVFSRYLPILHAKDDQISVAIQEDLRRNMLKLDDKEATDIDVTMAHDIYRGRSQLGPQVSLSHYRGVVLGITQYMEHRFGELGDAMLYAVGRQTGRRAAADIVADVGKDRAVEEFLHGLQSGAVGLPQVVQRTAERFTVRLDECAVCAGIRPMGSCECHYITGLFTGLMEVVWDQSVEAHETRCTVNGDAFCEFQVDRQAGKT
ncbi:MAG: V4R domain-containing protein [Thermoplasmatota archaeon]